MPALDDFKLPNGKWAQKHYNPATQKQVETLSGRKWASMNSRCKPGGVYQREHPAYLGCTNAFEGFDEFAEWHIAHPDYGKGYELDKDLLYKGNKIYSANTCSLLPERINTLLIGRRKTPTQLPLGVTNHRSGKYVARCQDGRGLRAYLGIFETPESAFDAYKEFKEALIQGYAEQWRDRVIRRTYEALKVFKVAPHD
jgi:hypothetical protein